VHPPYRPTAEELYGSAKELLRSGNAVLGRGVLGQGVTARV
jgi:hypothetical protein